MNPEFLLPVLTVLLSAFASVLGSWLVFRAQNRRIGSQNILDESNALEIQMRVNKDNALLIKDMQQKYAELYDGLKGQYRLEVTGADFDMGILVTTGTVETAGATLKIKKLKDNQAGRELPVQ